MKQVARFALLSVFLAGIYFLFCKDDQVVNGSPRNEKICLVIRKDGVILKKSDEGKWIIFNDGLPDEIEPLYIAVTAERLYLSTMEHGLFSRSFPGRSWEPVCSAGFKRRSLYESNPPFRKISAVAADPADSHHVVCATKHTMYESFNGGSTWVELKNCQTIKRHYITALLIYKKRIYIGTSYGGIFCLDSGKLYCINNGLPYESYSKTLKFYEEIASFGFSASDDIEISFIHDNDHYILCGNTWKKNTGSSCITDLPPDWRLAFAINNKALPFVQITTDFYGRSYDSGNEIRALYAGPPSLKKIEKLIDTAKRCSMNSLVIDMKDDEGRILFQSASALAIEAGAVRSSADINKILEMIHNNKMKAIARMVVFKDRKLFNVRNGRYATRDRITGKSWYAGNGEFWIDPSIKEVHDYIIGIACELQNIGFDEIQFDYIRFPSDGDTFRCNYTDIQSKGFYYSEIIEDFLKQSKKKLKVPVSVDIYGFNVWYRFGNIIGQDTEEMSRVVDILCPMIYPSHFGSFFLRQENNSKRTYDIIARSCIRGSLYTGNRCIIRPYLQAFRLLSPDWGEGYILNQVKGINDGGCHGYIFWNAAADYKVVEKALSAD